MNKKYFFKELEQAVLELQTERIEPSKTMREQNLKIREPTVANKAHIEDCNRLTAVNEQMRESMSQTLKEMRPINSCNESCQSFDSCSKRVLIVDGIERMTTFYCKGEMIIDTRIRAP